MRRLTCAFVVAAAATAFAMTGLVQSAHAAPAKSGVLVCVPMKVIIDEVQKPVLEITVTRAPVLALTLKRTAKNAPKAVARSMKQMASTYSALAKAKNDADRTKIAFARAPKFSAAARVVADYYSTHCVTTPVSSPNLPAVGGANQAACLADMRVLQLAETEYSTLNGGFGTMSQLVGAGLLRSPSAYHPEITVGTPPGGYTIVGNQGCGNVPVAG